jgi:hypothetical protein
MCQQNPFESSFPKKVATATCRVQFQIKTQGFAYSSVAGLET